MSLDIKNNADTIVNAVDQVSKKTAEFFTWFNQPKEEARQHAVELIKNSDALSQEEAIALIYNSRKLTREYANSKAIYEKAKESFQSGTDREEIDDDWLHFFFDKASKVSSESMRAVWSKLLAGEYNNPGSINRKLLHIISIMDVHSARSFQTLCGYVFERDTLFTSYATEALLIPSGFYEDALSFVIKADKWLQNCGYENSKDLSNQLIMNTGELNSLENLGLIQVVKEATCGIPLAYYLHNGTRLRLCPDEDSEVPLGKYSFTSEGQQLYQIVNPFGNEATFEIVNQYLISEGIKFRVQRI